MLAISVEVVLFAIRSGTKLEQQMRQAYVDSTKNRELVLPLPNYPGSPDMSSANNFFSRDGAAYVKDTPRLAELLNKYHAMNQLQSNEETEVMTFYKDFFYRESIKRGVSFAEGGSLLNLEEFDAMLKIRQWKRGEDPNPTTLQRLAGTFIEIGIDYFVNVPGALNKNSRQGKAIAGFLQGMNEIQFSEAQLGTIPGRLFLATVETISENVGLLSADAKVQELITVATKAVSVDVSKRLTQIGNTDLVKQERIGDWAELVFRSLLSSSCNLVLSNPKKYLGVNEGQSALIGQVGNAVLGLVLDDSNVSLDRLFSREGLEKLTKSALAVVGDHPEILNSNNAGLQKLLSEAATKLSRYDTLLTPDILPELTRLILDKTGENIALLWPDLANNPQQHLLLIAAETTLAILTQKPSNDKKWKLCFSRTDILIVVEAVFYEFTANPSWLLDDAGTINNNLKTVLETSIDIIRNRADNRLSTATAVDILRAVLTNIGARKEFLDKLPSGTNQEVKALFATALDTLFNVIFDTQLDKRATWQLVRTETINDLVNTCLTALAKARLNQNILESFSIFLINLAGRLANGEPFSLPVFEAELQKVLTV